MKTKTSKKSLPTRTVKPRQAWQRTEAVCQKTGRYLWTDGVRLAAHNDKGQLPA